MRLLEQLPFKYVSTSQGIQDDGMIRGLSKSSVTGIDTFLAEHVTTLMSHVIYGGDPHTMKDYQDASDKLDPNDTNEQSAHWKKWWNTLRLNLERRSGTMKVDVTKSNGVFTITIWRGSTVSCTYNTNVYTADPVTKTGREKEILERLYFTSIGKITLQSH